MNEQSTAKELEKLYKTHVCLAQKKSALEDISSYGGHKIVFTKSDRGDATPREVFLFANSNHPDMEIAHDVIKYAIRRYDKQMHQVKEQIDLIHGATDLKVYASVNSSDIADHIFVAKGAPYESEEDVNMKCIGAHFAITTSNDLLCPIKLITDSRELGYNLEHCRPANKEEVALLLEEIKKNRLVWDKHLEKLVPVEDVGIQAWMPKDGDPFWVCVYYREGWRPVLFMEEFSYYNEWKRGWVYRTKAACQKMCDRLNEAVEDVEPYKEYND